MAFSENKSDLIDFNGDNLLPIFFIFDNTVVIKLKKNLIMTYIKF